MTSQLQKVHRELSLEVYMRKAQARMLSDLGASKDAVERCLSGKGQYEAFNQDSELLGFLKERHFQDLMADWGLLASGQWKGVPIGHMLALLGSEYLIEALRAKLDREDHLNVVSSLSRTWPCR
ncbi:hypothetical protein PFICI_10873 [Pestalotiopsis fici W106-1]|uniref:Uncharacterized protein n=1 Tax=Pestalotiopsis fici (strain W106-1 / CGMCC3.15140) TaxID=1229662 RepID=W3WT53_PESFW|nr:uncharacterized protein PFICI_10873 [Pestalotiopsis fici W106-1]ETS76999.1 hypothetical protein PFICI_10873 [Pestalotiopsis fici W106-1]